MHDMSARGFDGARERLSMPKKEAMDLSPFFALLPVSIVGLLTYLKNRRDKNQP
jgi:hypothetical protein